MTREEFNQASVIHGKIRSYENTLELLRKGNSVIQIVSPMDTIMLDSEIDRQPSKNALIFLYENLLEQALAELAAL